MASRRQWEFPTCDAARDIKPPFRATGSIGPLTKLVAAGCDEPSIRQDCERLSDCNVAACLCPRSIRRDGNLGPSRATGKQLARR